MSNKQPTYFVWGLGRVLLNASFTASVHGEPQNVASVLEGAATQQHLVHGYRHCLCLWLGCTTYHVHVGQHCCPDLTKRNARLWHLFPVSVGVLAGMHILLLLLRSYASAAPMPWPNEKQHSQKQAFMLIDLA